MTARNGVAAACGAVLVREVVSKFGSKLKESARGGNRTRMRGEPRRILSPLRLPVPPPGLPLKVAEWQWLRQGGVGQTDRRTGGQADRRTGGQVDRRGSVRLLSTRPAVSLSSYRVAIPVESASSP